MTASLMRCATSRSIDPVLRPNPVPGGNHGQGFFWPCDEGFKWVTTARAVCRGFLHGQKIDLIHGESPFRALERTDPKAFVQHVENGRHVYYSNCFYCHGDALAGDGMFAHAFNPVPANFQDSGVLPNFQETFFFWRIAKGGPGMPDEGAPGDSVMPEWERFLSNDQIWDVILFLYSDTGYRPRTFEEGGEAKR